MKRLIQIVFCCIIISCTAQNQLKTQLENYMDAEASINNFSGTVLITKNDSILLKKAYGYADYEWEIKTTIDTKYSLASVSKQFTAAAILQLAENNQLSLDDTLIKFFPNLKNGGKITIKMLLSHNSGVNNDNNELFTSNKSYDSNYIIEQVMNKPLLFEPGTNTAYSNEGYYILASIIKKVSGISYATYLKEHIFKKIGMNNSGVSSNDSIFSKMSKTYYQKDNRLIKNPLGNWDYAIGMDGVYSTIDDLFKWNKNLFDSNILLSEESKNKMFASHNDQNFGYGVVVNPFYNHGHNLIAHDGGYFGTQTSFNKFIDDDIFVTALSNNGSPSYLIAYGLSAIALGIPVELPYKHTKIEVDSKIYSQYVGEYEGVKIHIKEGKLMYSGNNIELIPESKTKFFRADNNNRTIEFVKNKEGKTKQIIITTAGVKKIKLKSKC